MDVTSATRMLADITNFYFILEKTNMQASCFDHWHYEWDIFEKF